MAAQLGCTQSPPGDESCGTVSLKTHGIIPEYFAAGHVPFLMDVHVSDTAKDAFALKTGNWMSLLLHQSGLHHRGGL